ncbi:Patatin-like phospholipase domain-containing protein 4 [Aphelenchoides fujianensis]|nr:Patatin-like phospholipase domain-containing protein 4 [Aphelenchoides fujianensis]
MFARSFNLSSFKLTSALLVQEWRVQQFRTFIVTASPVIDPVQWKPTTPPADLLDQPGVFKKFPKELALSCSGCGFLGSYHFGVMMSFQKHAKELLSRVTRFAGASAGSLVATLMVVAPDKMEEGLNQLYEMADELVKLKLGALTPGYFLSERLASVVNRHLPEDVSGADGRLFISLTRQKDKTNRLVSKYPSREYLALCLNASCFIPIYRPATTPCRPLWTTRFVWGLDGQERGERAQKLEAPGRIALPPCIDGGFTNNLPLFDDLPTVTISPFAGSAMIAPRDHNRFQWELHFGTQGMRVNLQNVMRGAHSLFPPTREILQAYYELGHRDAMKFLLNNGILERTEGTEV